MPAVSKAQQRFMGMVYATKKGDMTNPSPEVAQAAASMKKSDAKDFASTKHNKLPEKKRVEEEKNCGCGQTPCKTFGKKVEKEETELDEYYGMPGGMGSSRSKGVRDNEKYQKSKDRVDSLLAAVRRGREKRKKMKEATDFSQRNKIMKKAKPLHKHLYKNLHKKDKSGDINENKKSFKDFLGDIYNSH